MTTQHVSAREYANKITRDLALRIRRAGYEVGFEVERVELILAVPVRQLIKDVGAPKTSTFAMALVQWDALVKEESLPALHRAEIAIAALERDAEIARNKRNVQEHRKSQEWLTVGRYECERRGIDRAQWEAERRRR